MQNTQRSVNLQGAEDSVPSAVRVIARGGRTSLLASIIGYGIRFGLQILLGRVLGASAYGLYALGRSVLEVTTRISLIGLPSSVVYFLAIFRGENDQARIRGIILHSVALVVGTSCVAALCLWLSAGWMSERIFEEPALVRPLRIFALALPLYALLQLLASCAQGFRSMKYYSGMTLVIQPLGNFLLIATAFWLGMKLEGAIWAFALSSGLSLLLMIRFTWRLFPQLFALKKGSLFESRRILSYSSKLIFASLSHLLLHHTDRLMLGYFGVARDVGIYSIAAFMGEKMTFFQAAFNSIFDPVISELFNKGKHGEVLLVFKTVSKWTLLLTLPIFFTFILFGQFILSLFGREFQEGQIVLVVLTVATLVNIGVGPVGRVLIMTGRPGVELTNNCNSLVVSILLNLWLIPRYGALGAAFATGFALALVNVMRLIQVYRIHHFHPFRFGTLKVLAAFALAGGLVWQLHHLYPFEGWWTLVAITIFLLSYFGLLTIFGWDEEDKFVLHQLRRKVRGLSPQK